ncbi:hypothetical protein D4764_17G0006740 [Takifugu flavidus]|uniref:DNA-directed DNA polymerase n=1 Tax=Takifugu flavidus TaxID=433684 RepID=A0A5C6NX53_9TELE|nr:hypothetical protein D4764_17G0006740 [Takifugu flavidus]
MGLTQGGGGYRGATSSQQQHEHHESVPEPLFDRVEEDTGCYIHSQHPQDKDERPGEGGSESRPSPHLSPQQGGGGLGENPSDLSPERGMLELDVTPQQILMNGSKILSFEESHYGLKFIDSLSFLPMRLSAMPKALGFTDKTKGYFPHKFSSEIHLNYVGPYPVPSDYGVDRMTVREREEFDPWYNEVSRGTFDFKKEASLYCKNDVDILTQGSLKFRDQFLVQCDMRGVTFGELHYKSEKRVSELQTTHGVRVVVMREHTWNQMKTTCTEVKEFLRCFNAPEPLNPRKALFGGRTSALKLRHTHAAPDETIHYVDVTSLYPFVNSTCSYPFGHPVIIYKDFEDPRSYYGFIRATVYPPRGLLFPVLPHKSEGGKLLCVAPVPKLTMRVAPANTTMRAEL